jgi:hypothetical protein
VLAHSLDIDTGEMAVGNVLSDKAVVYENFPQERKICDAFAAEFR